MIDRHVSLRACWVSQGCSLKFKDVIGPTPTQAVRCCVACDPGQRGGVDASEWKRKCEVAGIFYSCEYVHRAVLATFAVGFGTLS